MINQSVNQPVIG